MPRWMSALVLLAAPALAQPAVEERLLRIEDARAASDADVSVVWEAAALPDARLRRLAVRTLGRLERAPLLPLAGRALGDADAAVRAEAANAVAQLTRGAADVPEAFTLLAARLAVESDAGVRDALLRSLGRLPFGSEREAREAERTLVAALPADGAAKGLESLVRLHRTLAPPAVETIRRLRTTVAPSSAEVPVPTARARRLALAALTTAGAADAAVVERAVGDADHEVRRLAAAALGSDAPLEGRDALLARVLQDAHAQVRYEAVRAWGRQLQRTSCEPIRAAVSDADPHVALLALDQLGAGCPASEPSPAPLLEREARALPAGGPAWHRAAHALVALARIAPDAARALLPAHAGHATWQVRMYAARAAGALAADAVLRELARDADDNVRAAAIDALIALKRPEAVPAALDALARADYQLIMTAARALQFVEPGEPRLAAIKALRNTYARIVGDRRDTSRDAREAIRLTLGALNDTAALPDAPRAPVPPVTLAAVQALRGTTLRWVMKGKGHFDLRLLVDEAPLTALRIATRAREGYYDGLTFHRVVPNFVIQGGSPGANEYAGDAAYMRDEVGLPSHTRGTVGISTRGRDTGDAQIFVNLVDLPRLDHAYTVFAEVAAGMDVVDRILEGDVIERVEILRDRPR
ncbi:MAG: peptidylprolyl isomerase [Acidobacteriota bacterium]